MSQVGMVPETNVTNRCLHEFCIIAIMHIIVPIINLVTSRSNLTFRVIIVVDESFSATFSIRANGEKLEVFFNSYCASFFFHLLDATPYKKTPQVDSAASPMVCSQTTINNNID